LRPSTDDPKTMIADVEFRPGCDPFLVDHRLQQRPILPAVILLEAFAETSQALDPGKRVAAIHDLELHSGLRFSGDDSRTVQVRAELAQGMVRCQLTADFRNRKGEVVDPNRLHASAVVELTTAGRKPEIAYQSCVEPWHPVWFPPPSNLMYHGPTFQLLKRCAFAKDGQVWGEVIAADIKAVAGNRSPYGWVLHPAVIDASLYLCGVAVWVGDGKSVALPHSFACLRLGRPAQVGETCLVHLQPLTADERESTFDIVCYGANRDVLFAIDAYRCQIISRPGDSDPSPGRKQRIPD
jgi:hypothetical protein